jgi:hypothetical protein
VLILKLLLFGGFFAHFDLAGLNQLPRDGYFPVESNSSGGFLVYSELFISGGTPNHSSGRFLVCELVIPSGIIIPLVDNSLSMRW